MDCGEGTQLRIAQYGIKRDRIKTICISHLHGDHYLGLMGVLSSMHLLGRTKPLVLIGPKGLKDILTLQMKYSSTVLKYSIQYVEVLEQTKVYEDKKLTIESFPLSHRIPCFGYKFVEKEKPLLIDKAKLTPDIQVRDIVKLKSGEDVLHDDGTIKLSSLAYTLPRKPRRSYAFCSDTRFDDQIIPYIQGVDLLYHESTFLESDATIAEKTYHATAFQAATIAKTGNVDRLIIGHFSARYRDINGFLDEAKEVFPNTFLAKEGDKYCVDE
jgi:ribonuclease Z